MLISAPWAERTIRLGTQRPCESPRYSWCFPSPKCFQKTAIKTVTHSPSNWTSPLSTPRAEKGPSLLSLPRFQAQCTRARAPSWMSWKPVTGSRSPVSPPTIQGLGCLTPHWSLMKRATALSNLWDLLPTIIFFSLNFCLLVLLWLQFLL